MDTRNIQIGADYAILPGAKAVVTFSSPDDAANTKNVKPVDNESSEWSYWGDDNLFPQNVLADLEKNSISLRALEKRKSVHFGRGIIAYRDGGEDENKPNERKRIPITKETDPDIFEFFRINRINRQWPDLIGSLETFANAWIELITNKGHDKINRVFFKDPCYCRLSKMDANARINDLYYSAQWEDSSPSLSDGSMLKIPMFDPTKYNGTTYQDPKFIYPLFYRSFNKSYYHLAVWNGIRTSGWMDIANKVPSLKKAIMKNQMVIKYHITVPDDYFANRFPSPDFSPEQREAKKKEVLEELDKFLSDSENAGKSFVTFSFYSIKIQDYLTGWKIDAIDDKLKDDAYLPDSQAANSEILFAMGVDPCLIGGSGVPGEKMGSGSGSDKREAFWMLNADMGIYRQVSLEPLEFIRDFNGWDPDVKFDYVTVDTSQTQSQRPTKTEKRIDETQK